MIKYRKISEICKIFSGNSINEKIKKEKYSKGKDGIEYISTKDIGYDLKIDYKNIVKIPHGDLDKFRIAPPNTVFICAEGGSAGRKFAISDRQLCFVNKLFAIVSSEKVLPKFIFYFIQSENFNKKFKSAITGLIGGVSLNKFKEFEIPILPILDQERIVAKLDKIFAEIDKASAAAETNIKNAEALFKSYLTKIFNSINNSNNLKFLSDICDVRDGTHNSPKYFKEGIPFVTQKNIREDGLDFNNVKFIKYEDHSMYYKRSNVAYGDILISMIGANRGMSAIVDDKRVFSIKNVCLVKKGNKVNQNYLLYYFKSKQAQDYIKLFSKGGAQDFISLTVLRKFPILVPSNEMQEKILKKFNSIYSLTKLIKQKSNEKLTLIKKLKQSILYKAFNQNLIKVA